MPKITFIAPDGGQQTFEAPTGTSVMQVAVANGVDGIVAECGGSAMCATCHCYVDAAFSAQLPAMSDIEDEMLEGAADERLPESRLSCQIVLTEALDGIVVRLPAHQI